MKKYGFGEGVTNRHIGKLNAKGNLFLDKEVVSYDELLQIFENLAKYINKEAGTKEGDATVIKVDGKEIVGFKIY